jgi:hypothetical protein
MNDKSVIEYIREKKKVADGDLSEEAMLAQAFLDDVRDELIIEANQ